MAKRKRHEQTSIPGTETEIPESVKDSVHKWLDDCDEQRQVSKRRKMSHDVMLQHMAEAGIDRAPYIDSLTGKKKHVYADRTAKAKVINAPRPPKNDNRDRDYDRPEVDAEITLDPNADKVEMRRVSRASVAEEIGEVDGFASVRALMNKTEH